MVPEQLLELVREPFLLVFLGLCAVTFYRKELSVNSDYDDDSDDDFVLNADTARHAASEVAKAACDAQAAARNQLGQLYASASERLVANDSSDAASVNATGTSVAAKTQGGIRTRARTLSCEVPLLELLPPDVVGATFAFLDYSDVLRLAPACRAMARTCDKPLDDPIDCVWRDRWRARFGALWLTPEVQSAAARHHVHWDPLTGDAFHCDNNNAGGVSKTSNNSNRDAADTVTDVSNRSCVKPGHTWRSLFFEFDECWQDWVLAGHNRRLTISAATAATALASTPPPSTSTGTESGTEAFSVAATPMPQAPSVDRAQQRCLVALHGGIYDLSQFLDQHPGSPETLLDNAGSDTTGFFEDVGHSRVARRFAAQISLFAPLSPIRRSAAAKANTFMVPASDDSKNSSSDSSSSSSRNTSGSSSGSSEAPATGSAVQFVTGAFGRFAPPAGPSSASHPLARLRSPYAHLGPAARAAAATARAEAKGVGAFRTVPPSLGSSCACSTCGLPKEPLVFPHPRACPAEQKAMQELCERRQAHVGECRVYFDPFAREWACWWACCHYWEPLPKTA